MGNIWDRYKGAESGEGVETIEAGLRASQIGVDLTEEEQKILKEPEEKARQQASDQLQRALDGQDTPTMGNGLVEAARMRNEAAQDGGKGKKKKKSDAAMQLLLAQLSDFQAQIDWYDGEIERLRNAFSKNKHPFSSFRKVSSSLGVAFNPPFRAASSTS